jgi:segregation and condensation protein A
MKAYERTMQRYHDRFNKPVHTVVKFNYTMEGVKADVIAIVQNERTLSFQAFFAKAENRVHAIFTFLSMLELVQQNFLRIIIGEGRNNFIIEYNETAEGLTDEEHMRLL